MQHTVGTKCDKCTGTERKDGAMGGYKVKNSNKTVYKTASHDENVINMPHWTVAPPKECNLKRKMSKINTYKSCYATFEGRKLQKMWNVHRGAT